MKSLASHDVTRGVGGTWMRLLLVVGLAVSVVVLYRGDFAAMAGLWSLSSYKHGYAIAPLCLYLLWLARSGLTGAPVVGSVPGLVLCVLLTGLYLVGSATSVQVARHVAIVLMIPALTLTVLGWRSFRPVAFPLLFLLAAVPVGEEIVPLLLRITAGITAVLLQLSGIPFLREGLFFSLPGADFEIAEVCSGVRYLLAGGVTAVLFAYLNFATWRKRLAFVAAAAAGFVVANALRAYLVMAIASATHGQWLGGRDHIYFGMVLFLGVLMVLLWVGLRHADPHAARPTVPDEVVPRRHGGLTAAALGIAAIVALAVGPWVTASRGASVAVAEAAVALPRPAGCSEAQPWAAPWRPRLVGATSEAAASYDCDGVRAHVFVARYAVQRQGAELAGAANEIVPHAWRRVTERAARDVVLPGGASLSVNEAVVRDRGSELATWYWYAVNGVPVRTATGVKLREVFSAFRRAPSPSELYLVAVETTTEGDAQLRRSLNDLAVQVWTATRADGS